MFVHSYTLDMFMETSGHHSKGKLLVAALHRNWVNVIKYWHKASLQLLSHSGTGTGVLVGQCGGR